MTEKNKSARWQRTIPFHFVIMALDTRTNDIDLNPENLNQNSWEKTDLPNECTIHFKFCNRTTNVWLVLSQSQNSCFVLFSMRSWCCLKSLNNNRILRRAMHGSSQCFCWWRCWCIFRREHGLHSRTREEVRPPPRPKLRPRRASCEADSRTARCWAAASGHRPANPPSEPWTTHLEAKPPQSQPDCFYSGFTKVRIVASLTGLVEDHFQWKKTDASGIGWSSATELWFYETNIRSVTDNTQEMHPLGWREDPGPTWNMGTAARSGLRISNIVGSSQCVQTAKELHMHENLSWDVLGHKFPWVYDHTWFHWSLHQISGNNL